MPLPKGTKYRTKTTKSGKKVRLAFNKKGDVIEAKNLKTGTTHTSSEFRKDKEELETLHKKGSWK